MPKYAPQPHLCSVFLAQDTSRQRAICAERGGVCEAGQRPRDTTAWAEFSQLRAEDLNNGGAGVTVFDCWRLLANTDIVTVSDYLTLGVNTKAPDAAAEGIALAEAEA